MIKALNHFNSFYKKNQLSTQKLLVACSGGIDSMVLLHLLIQQNTKVAVVHCNFGLRQDANADEHFVKAYCEQQQVPFFSQNFQTKTYAQEQGISIQMAARTLRYSYFNELLNSEGFDLILTAHHADDSLETILLNLGRGTGLDGLTGISPLENQIARPLWRWHKDDIKSYAQQQKLAWREDVSNAKTDYQRNFLRHKVLPPLKENAPNFERSFGKTLQHLKNDKALWQDMLQEKLATLVSQTEAGETFNWKAVAKPMQLPSLIRHWLQPKAVFDWTAILKSLDQGSGQTFEAEAYKLTKNRGELILSSTSNENKKQHDTFFIEETDTEIDFPLTLHFDKKERGTTPIDSDLNVAQLDFNKLTFPLELRLWRAGDHFTPLGMKGQKKLSDFFTDAKINPLQKKAIWVLCSQQKIVWVVGMRIDDYFRLTNQTKSVYFVRLLKQIPE